MVTLYLQQHEEKMQELSLLKPKEPEQVPTTPVKSNMTNANELQVQEYVKSILGMLGATKSPGTPSRNALPKVALMEEEEVEASEPQSEYSV